MTVLAPPPPPTIPRASVSPSVTGEISSAQRSRRGIALGSPGLSRGRGEAQTGVSASG